MPCAVIYTPKSYLVSCFSLIRHTPASLSVEEIFQNAQANVAGLFGVKLCRENIFSFNSRGNFFAVICRCRDNFFVVGGSVVAVHEIKIRLAAQARE